MRPLATLLLLALVATAQPPVAQGFVRMKRFKDEILTRLAQLKADEEFASKPIEEKMLLAFLNGDKKFGNEQLTGKLVVTTCLMKWADVQRAEPTEAGKRVLAKLPEVLSKRYGEAIDVPRDRKEVSKFLLDALDSDLVHVQQAALDSLMKMYRTGQAFMYVPGMNKKQRAAPIKSWTKFVLRQK